MTDLPQFPAQARDLAPGSEALPTLLGGRTAPPAYDLEQIRGILPQLIDALSDPMIVVDREHRVVAANRRYLEAFGRSGEPVIGLTCHDAVSCPLQSQGVSPGGCLACDVVGLAQPRRIIHVAPDASGALLRWEAALNPVLDSMGRVSHVVEVWRDITQRSQLEGQLSHSERLASIGLLAAGVAHEINNPMASILAGVNSLSRWVDRSRELDPENAREAREVLGMLERETLRCREITDKLLLLAQPYTGESKWVDVNRAGRDTLSVLSYPVRNQGITVVEDFEEGLAPVWGRESGVRGVWMNLCLNAVQAMSDGGTLTVRTREQSDSVSFEVEDTGPGIAAHHLERIWDPFFTTKPTGKGTGLGLSITRTIVEKHGGRIEVDSAPGRGARFVVELPRNGRGGERV